MLPHDATFCERMCKDDEALSRTASLVDSPHHQVISRPRHTANGVRRALIQRYRKFTVALGGELLDTALPTLTLNQNYQLPCKTYIADKLQTRSPRGLVRMHPSSVR
jgi:hypothetical protein